MSIGGTELLIIVVFGFLLFGPDKLPQIGRTLGRALRQFRETQQKMTAVVQSEVIDPMSAAVNDSAAGKSAKAAAAMSDDADADEGEGSDAPAPRKETFAERRARLAAEKAEREAAADAEPAAAADASEAAASDAGASDAAPEVASSAEAAPAADSAPAAEPAPEAEPAHSTADLYARRPRRKREAESETGDAPTDDAATEGGER